MPEHRARLAVCAAMRWEVQPVLRALGPIRRVRHDGLTLWVRSDATPPVLVFRTGLGQENAAKATAKVLEAFPGLGVVINTGCAGALVPGLVPGSLVIPAEIHDAAAPDKPPFPASSEWVERLNRSAAAAGFRPDGGPIHSTRRPLTSAAAKHAAHRLRRATAVEMEGAGVARVAQRHGIGFAAVRSILDDVTTEVSDLPEENTDGLIGRFKLHLASVAHVADLTPLFALPGGVRAVRTALHGIFRALFEGRPVIGDWFEIAR